MCKKIQKFGATFTWETNSKVKLEFQGREATLFLDKELFSFLEEESVEQIKKILHLHPEGEIYVMPDVHVGYGFPIGGVAGFPLKNAIISPGGVGFDINCGVRAIKVHGKMNNKQIKQFIDEMFKRIPVGEGKKTKLKITSDFFSEVLHKGAQAINEKDSQRIEENGKFNASQEYLSEEAIKRGKRTLGTLGGGNHFLEVQEIEEVKENYFGLEKGNTMIMLHTGSRGFGHQIASDFIRLAKKKNNFAKNLEFFDFHSEEGQNYFVSMGAAINFAFANRQLITEQIYDILNKMGFESELLYDVAHNIAKIETYHGKKYLIHRKGATRALSKGNKLLVKEYRKIGQPVLIPGDMARPSFILVGNKAEELSLGSINHGAGRILSRKKAREKDVEKFLQDKKIYLRASSMEDVAEEASYAYKDIEKVIKVVEENELATKVAKLVPKGVIL